MIINFRWSHNPLLYSVEVFSSSIFQRILTPFCIYSHRWIFLIRPVLNVFSYFKFRQKKNTKTKYTHSDTWYKSLECNYSTQLGNNTIMGIIVAHNIIWDLDCLWNTAYPPCRKTMIMCVRNALSSVTKKKYVFRATNCIFNGRQCEGCFFSIRINVEIWNVGIISRFK